MNCFIRSCSSANAGWFSIKEALTSKKALHENIKTQGWIRSVRRQKEVLFMDINDGSSLKNLQAILSSNSINLDKPPSVGMSVQLEGTLVPSTHPKQPVELLLSAINVLGDCDPQLYPFKAHTKHSLDYTRQYPHMRSRTNAFSSVLRVRNTATMALHDYFQQNDFIYLHTPIITSCDCEGAGDMFQVLPSIDTTTVQNRGHFFDIPAYLTVSGQLHAETVACGMSKVYTFGPTFRAEKSHTRRHLSEFYMAEAEMVTQDQSSEKNLDYLMKFAEELCKTVIERVLQRNSDEVNFLNNGSKDYLHGLLDQSYKKITYTEAIDMLINANRRHLFKFEPQIGHDLASEHEQYLVDHFQNIPVFVTHFPSNLKPFYTRAKDEDDKTALAMDLLMPNVGEVVGGTIREERQNVLEERLKRLGIINSYQWYLDLRRFGTVPHGGFGLGFERLLQVILGLENIRDVIPYPRYLGSCPM